MAEVVIQSLSRVWFFANPWTAAHQASLSFTVSWSWFRFMSTELVMLSNHHILCYPLLLLPSIFPSNRVFDNELALPMECLKYWRFSFSISPSNEFSGLIFFCIDWFDLLAVQETLKCLIQHHSSKASILQFSAFFVVQLSHPQFTTGKTIALTIRTVASKAMSLPFTALSRFVMAFLPRSKCPGVMTAVSIRSEFGGQEKKICYCFPLSPHLFAWSDGTGCHDHCFMNAEF